MKNNSVTSSKKFSDNVIDIIVIIISALVAYFVLAHYANGFEEKKKRESSLNNNNLAMGDDLELFEGTSSYYAWEGEYPIHYGPGHFYDKYIDGDLIETRFFNGWKARGEKPVILWFGNSQMNGVNQYEEGQQSAAERLYYRTKDLGYDALTVSLPNLRMVECYPIFVNYINEMSVKYLIISLTFSDFRYDNVRKQSLHYLSRESIINELEKSEIGQSILAQNSEENNSQNYDLAGLAETLQEKVELGIVTYLDNHWLLWKYRPDYRKHLYRFSLTFRNSILGISPQRKRPVNIRSYHISMDCLRNILELANESGIKSMVYLSPVRSDLERPYYENQFQDYRNDIINLTNQYGVEFRDFSEIIPGEYYGSKEATNVMGGLEVDFKHFTANAHEILADSVYTTISTMIEEK